MDADLLERANRLARSYENDRDRIARLYANHPDRNDGRDLLRAVGEILLVGFLAAIFFKLAALVFPTLASPDAKSLDMSAGSLSWTLSIITSEFVLCAIVTWLLQLGSWLAQTVRAPKRSHPWIMALWPLLLIVLSPPHGDRALAVIAEMILIWLPFAYYFQYLIARVPDHFVFWRVSLAMFAAFLFLTAASQLRLVA